MKIVFQFNFYMPRRFLSLFNLGLSFCGGNSKMFQREKLEMFAVVTEHYRCGFCGKIERKIAWQTAEKFFFPSNLSCANLTWKIFDFFLLNSPQKNMECLNRPSFCRQKAPGSKLLTEIYVVQQSIIFFPYCVRYALCADDNHVFSLSCGKKKFCYSLCCREALNALKFKSEALNIISLMSYTTASVLWVSWSF